MSRRTERAVRPRDMGFEVGGALPGEGPRGDSPPALYRYGGSAPLFLGDQIDLSGPGDPEKVRPGRDRSGLHLLDDVTREDRVRWSPRVAPGSLHANQEWQYSYPAVLGFPFPTPGGSTGLAGRENRRYRIGVAAGLHAHPASRGRSRRVLPERGARFLDPGDARPKEFPE